MKMSFVVSVVWLPGFGNVFKGVCTNPDKLFLIYMVFIRTLEIEPESFVVFL